MENIYTEVSQIVGDTPLLELTHIAGKAGFKARVLAKLEYFNPSGSVKDRAAKKMLDTAEKEGKLAKGGTIIEPTSGNTGIGLAAIAAARGYRAILTMPETMSTERRKLLKAYGVELVLTPGAEGMKGAIKRAQQLVAEIPGSFMPSQFENPANAQAHYETTGPEIWRDTKGMVDIFVAGVGTGGTLTGAGRYLKEQKQAVCVVAVEPAASAVLSGEQAGPHKIQGIGAGFVPAVLDADIYDRIAKVRFEDAVQASRKAAAEEGILVGISSGAALWEAFRLAAQDENAGKTIVVLLPDTGERYLSTELFE